MFVYVKMSELGMAAVAGRRAIYRHLPLECKVQSSSLMDFANLRMNGKSESMVSLL
jgi:predicted component of type VI protein secretion system